MIAALLPASARPADRRHDVLVVHDQIQAGRVVFHGDELAGARDARGRAAAARTQVFHYRFGGLLANLRLQGAGIARLAAGGAGDV
ncbi:hypothetical protein G6F60_014353 [Rhizopus arrhizus]|nr:hypothetical protein G6F60_014353 [Rhizopus arrhizus]